MKTKIINSFLFIAFIIITISWFSACDFSSRTHKDILSAQKSLYEHDYLRAANIYENVIRANPPIKTKIKIYYQLAEIYSIHLGDPQKAVYYFKEIQNLSDDPFWQVKVEEKLGDLYFLFLKDYLRAIETYQKLVNFRPLLEKHDFYEYRLGISYLESKGLNKAIEIFEEVKKNPEHAYYGDAFYYLGLSYFHLEKWEKAIEFWEQHLNVERKKDKIVQTKFLMANAYETIEKLEEAYNLYYSILGDYPNTAVLKNRLKSLYTRRISRKR